MLEEQLRHLKVFGIDPIVKWDGVDFMHRGKDLYWLTWNEMLEDCKKNEADIYLFMPDDFERIDIDKIKELHQKRECYAYNIINDGREKLFNRQVPYMEDGDINCGFVDCGFFCDRKALDVLGYHIDRPEVKEDSSGVGRALSNKFFLKIEMYKPVKSLAYHGNHESLMHPDIRKKTPLISL